MKKNLLFKSILVASLGIAFFTLKSNSNGNGGFTTTGCKGCHGNVAVATTSVNLLGLPANGYTPGATYTLTIMVGSTNTALDFAGFGLNASAGNIATIIGSGTTIKGGDLVQSFKSPFVVNIGQTGWDFTWMAPTSGTVTFNAVGNAVNGDGNSSSADQWNTASFTINEKAAPQAIANVAVNKLSISPNPCNTKLEIANTSALKNINIVGMNGSICNVSTTILANTIIINTDNLASGLYFVSALENGVLHFTKFIKNQ